jgi:hypothetical protein
MFNDKLHIFTYKNTIYQSKLKLLAIYFGKNVFQAICVWATLIQVYQENPASVWWTAHARNRLVDENVFCWKI